MTRRLTFLLAMVIALASVQGDGFAAKKKRRKKKAPKVEEVSPPAPETQTPDVEIEVNPDEKPGDQPVPEVPVEVPGPPPEEPTVEIDPNAPPDPAEKKLVLGEQRVSWKDIVVVKRKPFLKASRLELRPMWGITLNDNMIQHMVFNGQLTFWLTDVLGVGVEGQYFIKQLLEPYDIIGRQYRRLPTLNQYNFGGAVNFHYVPVYAKFAMLNKYIVHWEMIFTAGVGFTQSEVLPRNPGLPGWKNFLITPNVGLTSRVFLTRWLTLDLGVKDYIFVDKFEDVMRTIADVEDAKANADSRLINHIMFLAGISFWIPPSFKYTTFR